ncbi:MAG: hypothetical protein U0172_01365 [Nitrospiraceae bacterium]
MNRRIPFLALTVALAFGNTDDHSAQAADLADGRGGHTSQAPFEWIGKTELKPTTFQLPTPFLRLKDVRPDSLVPTTTGLASSTTLFNGALRADSEVARNDESTQLVTRIDNNTQSMMRLGLTGTQGALRYGLSYRHADRAFLNAPDQRVREVWGEWGTGPLRLRSSSTNLMTNVDADPSRARMSSATNRLTMTMARPEWPELSLSYIRLSNEINPLLSGLTAQNLNSNGVEGTLAITRPTWNARVSSTCAQGTLAATDHDTMSYTHVFSGAFRPIEPLSITSVISYRTDVQQWTGVRTDTPVASLAVHYRHSSRWMLTAMGGYTGVKTSDGMTDNETLNSKGVVTWSPFGSPVHQVSFETGYSRTVMGGTSGTGIVTQDVSGLVRLRVSEF